MIINEENPERAKHLIKQAEHPIIVLSQNPEFDRKLLEYGKFDTLLIKFPIKSKQSLRQINANFNHFFARLANKKAISIGFDLNSVIEMDKKEKALSLSKIAEIIRICRKAEANIAVKSKKSVSECRRLLSSLGASTIQTKKAIYLE